MAKNTATMTKQPQAEEQPRIAFDSARAVFLPASNMQPADLKWTSWQVLIPADHTWDDVTRPDYWRHRVRGGGSDSMASALKAGDVIELRHEGWAFWARLLVRSVDALSKQIATIVLDHRDLSTAKMVAMDWSMARVVEIDGPTGPSAVVHYGKRTLSTHGSRAEAEAWLAEQRRKAAV